MLLDEAISALAVGIAYAEGFYVSGSRPARNHNPGDLTVDITGKGIGHDGMFVVYATDNDGWDALKAQVSKIFTNTSSIYNSDMTINDIAARYTTTDQTAWAMNVASKLGVSPDTKVSDLLASAEDIATTSISLGALILAVVAFWYLRKKK
jgi:hypothetical protein